MGKKVAMKKMGDETATKQKQFFFNHIETALPDFG